MASGSDFDAYLVYIACIYYNVQPEEITMFYVNTVISVIIVGCFVSFFEGFWEKTWERSTFAR